MDEHLYENVILGTYGMNVTDFSEEMAARVRDDVDHLRRNFWNTICHSEYGTERLRNAYMMAYYPYYVEPMRQVMEDWVIPLMRKDYNDLKLSFFSAGPCPEMVGVLEALKDNVNYGHLGVQVHDLERGWTDLQELSWNICMQEGLCSPMDSLLHVSGCDNMMPCDNCRIVQRCQQDMYRETDLYFMQNYLSHVRNVEEYLMQLRERLCRMKWGAMFVIVDLDYKNVRIIMESICSELPLDIDVRGTNIWDLQPATCRYPFPLPPGLKERIFVGDAGGKRLIPKLNTRYYYAVLQKRGNFLCS